VQDLETGWGWKAADGEEGSVMKTTIVRESPDNSKLHFSLERNSLNNMMPSIVVEAIKNEIRKLLQDDKILRSMLREEIKEAIKDFPKEVIFKGIGAVIK